MGIFDLLKPSPHIPEIEDASVVKERYKYWRFRIFYGMYIGYIFYYFARKSFTFAMPSMMEDLGLQISDLGILSSILSITYGVSKFISGILSDRANPRFFMGFGLILAGVFNILFGMSSSILCFIIFWALNGWFQGWGWPPCARLLTHWYSQKERGTWWGVWNTSHSVGGALIPIVAAFCAQAWGWRYAMYLPGATCIIMGIFLMNRLRDTPQSLGLPTIEKFKNDHSGEKGDDKELSVKEILLKHVLKNKFIWILAISYFFIYVIRQAVNDFGALYLMKTKGYSIMAASASVFWFEAGGICGSLAAGWASDRIFKGRRGPINALFSFGVIFAILGWYMVPPGMLFLEYFLMFIVGFLIFGPQMLIGIAAAELSHKKAAGTATGFTGWWGAGLGAAAAGYPMSKVAEVWGWQGFFIALGLCGVCAVSLLTPLWKIRGQSEKSEEPKEIVPVASEEMQPDS